MRAVLAILVVFCLPGLWSEAAAARAVEDLQTGLQLVQQGKFAQARKRLDSALESPGLSRQQRGLAHLVRALANMGLEDRKAARADLDQAVDLLEDAGIALQLRSHLAWQADDNETAYKDVLRLAREFPQDLADVEIRLIWDLWRWLKAQERADEAFTLLDSVVAAGYKPGAPGVRADGLVKEVIGGRLDRGRQEGVMALVERLTSADLLIEMRVNGRFKALWDEAKFDKVTEPLGAAKRELDFWITASGLYPKNLSVLFNRMQILRALGDWKEAIELGQAAQKEIENFEDRERFGLWPLNELANAYQDAGRPEDGDALLKPLLERSTETEPRLVSQFINYGLILVSQGRAQEALDAVAKARGGVSPYGRNWIDSVEACAHHQLGNGDQSQAALDRLKAKAADNFAAVSGALLCMDRIDEAAALAVTRLQDPDHREAMLMALQSFKERAASTDFEKQMASRVSALRNHPTVVAEAQKHGRILEIPLYSVYWGDF